MNKEQKIKAYKLLIESSLSYYNVVESIQSTEQRWTRPPSELEETRRKRRALKDCANELALPTCSINKVETILKNLVDHE